MNFLTVLVVLLVFVRRRRDVREVDIRDGLAKYDEEGGGETDTAVFDPSVLKVSLIPRAEDRKVKAGAPIPKRPSDVGKKMEVYLKELFIHSFLKFNYYLISLPPKTHQR